MKHCVDYFKDHLIDVANQHGLAGFTTSFMGSQISAIISGLKAIKESYELIKDITKSHS